MVAARMEQDRDRERARRIAIGTLRVRGYVYHMVHRVVGARERVWLDGKGHTGVFYIDPQNRRTSKFNRRLNRDNRSEIPKDEMALESYILVASRLRKMRLGETSKRDRILREGSLRALCLGVHHEGLDPERLPNKLQWEIVSKRLDNCPGFWLEALYLEVGRT
jgi:hypothetical protein